MKKLLYIVLFTALLLSGCEKKSAEFAPASLFEMNGSETAAGLKTGDGPKAFKAAYGGYTIQVAFAEQPSNYRVMSASKIPYDENISTIIANFFIDEEPVSEDWLCKENGIDISGLHELLSSPDYLQQHDVVYRYLNFHWEEGVITDIDSEELNYNETFETPRLD